MFEIKLTKAFNEFFDGEKGGILLIACTLISLVIANSTFSETYFNFWHYNLAGLSIGIYIKK